MPADEVLDLLAGGKRDLPEDELRWLEGYATDPRLPAGTWTVVGYPTPPEVVAKGAPLVTYGVWGQVPGVSPVTAIPVAVSTGDGAQDDAIVTLVAWSHQLLPWLIHELRLLRGGAGLVEAGEPGQPTEEHLRQLEAFVADAPLPGGAWRWSRRPPTPEEAAAGAVVMVGVWSDERGATYAGDPGAVFVTLPARDEAQGKAVAELVLLAHTYLPIVVREIRRRRSG